MGRFLVFSLLLVAALGAPSLIAEGAVPAATRAIEAPAPCTADGASSEVIALAKEVATAGSGATQTI